jgi:signal transduction histidine kinase/CheY-like chemotaxis protein
MSDRQCVFADWHLEKQLGPSPESLEDLLKLLPDTATNPSQQFLTKLNSLKPGDSFAIKFDRAGLDNQQHYFKIVVSPFSVFEKDAALIKIEDVTKEANLYMEVETLGRQTSVGRVAAGVAHEFNNILTAMLGWTQLAVKASRGNASALHALETIENNTKRAKDIASELLRLTRPGTLENKLINIGETVNEALKLLSWEINTAHIQVETEISSTDFCYGNATRFVQVFINIIRNSLDATPSGGSLKVKVAQVGSTVIAEFKDSGNGIAEDIIDNIFTPFFTTKVKGADNVHGGSGLGLSISRQIINDFGGEIEIKSRRPGGTIVTVKVPGVTDREADAAEVSEKNNSSFPPGIAVLVVDDEPDICEMIKVSLTLKGAHVVVATNGQKALELCKKEMFNAAFLDFSMSGLSGHDLGNAIAEVQPELPVIFMSGVEVPYSKDASYSDFLKKPFSLHEIQCKLKEVLDR